MRFSVNVLPAAIALASFMTREADAIYLPGIVRLFRGDQDDPLDGGTLNDSIDGMHMQFLGSGLTYPDETPYGDDTRKVFHFTGGGDALGSGLGLPKGKESRTIMAWIKIPSASSSRNEIPFGYGELGLASGQCSGVYQLWLRPDYKYEIDQACHDEKSGLHITPINQWFHVVGTYDEESGYNAVYENGEEKGGGLESRINTGGDDDLYTYLGGHRPRTDVKLNGYVADYAIFNRALSADEIKSVFESKHGVQGPLTIEEKYSLSLVLNSTEVAFDNDSKTEEVKYKLKVADGKLDELHDITILDYNTCGTEFNKSLNLISAAYDKDNKVADGSDERYWELPILVDVNTAKFNTPALPDGYFTELDGTNEVRLKFCAKSELGQSDIINLDANGNELSGNPSSSISYTKVKFDITINMVTGFTTNLNIEEKSASTASENVKIAYTLNAFECNDDDTTITNPSNKNQNSMVRICIQTPENNDVVIASIKDFKLKSDSIVSNAISGSDANTLTTVSGEGSKKVAVTTQMVSAFFSDLQPDTASTITVEGTAVMEFKATGERRLVRISSNQKNGNVSDMDRKLDGDAGLGEFEMKVGISKSSSEENGAATSGASNALSVAPLMTVTSLAIGGVLMGTMF